MPQNLAELPPEGDPTQEEIWTAVGYALTQWEFAEQELLNLAAKFIGAPRASPEARDIYYGKIFSERLTNLSELHDRFCVSHHSQEKEGNFALVVKAATSLSQKRNDIAHGTVVLLRQSSASIGPGGLVSVKSEFCLVPGYYDKRRVDPANWPSYAYTARDIRQFGADFEELAQLTYKYSVLL